MTTYYKLSESVLLRGWQDHPYALVIRPENTVRFVSEGIFQLLEFCDGLFDTDMPFFPGQTRRTLKELEEQGYITQCAKGEKITEEQRYRKYENRFIRSINFSITGRCNYHCKHCYLSAPETASVDLPLETIYDIIAQMEECGVPEVLLTGGEPLVRQDLEDIISAFAARKIWISCIFSNGKLVTPALLDMLERYGFKPQFNMSYDGDAGWHDWLRGVPHAGEIVLDAFDLCRERGFPTAAEFSIHKGNKDVLRESINTLASHGCSSLKVNVVADVGSWKSQGGNYSLSVDEMFQIFLAYIPHYFKDGMPLDIMLHGFFMGKKGDSQWLIPLACSNQCTETDDILKRVVCVSAYENLYISPDGHVTACSFIAGMEMIDEFPLITEVGLRKTVSDSMYAQLFGSNVGQLFDQNKECNNCEAKYVCAGGCRGNALMYENDFFGKDRIACKIFREGWDKQIRDTAEAAISTYVSRDT